MRNHVLVSQALGLIATRPNAMDVAAAFSRLIPETDSSATCTVIAHSANAMAPDVTYCYEVGDRGPRDDGAVDGPAVTSSSAPVAASLLTSYRNLTT